MSAFTQPVIHHCLQGAEAWPSSEPRRRQTELLLLRVIINAKVNDLGSVCVAPDSSPDRRQLSAGK